MGEGKRDSKTSPNPDQVVQAMGRTARQAGKNAIQRLARKQSAVGAAARVGRIQAGRAFKRLLNKFRRK